MTQNIVGRANKMAIKDFLTQSQHGIRIDHLLACCVEDFKENLDVPHTTNPGLGPASPARRASGWSTSALSCGVGTPPVPGATRRQPLQEQHRGQGRRCPTLTTGAFSDMVRHLVACFRRPPGHEPQRPCRHRAGRARPRASRSASAATSSSRGRPRDDPERPINNTRDEPHAVTDRYRRLHVIIGDASHCDEANRGSHRAPRGARAAGRHPGLLAEQVPREVPRSGLSPRHGSPSSSTRGSTGSSSSGSCTAISDRAAGTPRADQPAVRPPVIVQCNKGLGGG
jgi:hypothetical protein